ncbi:hypothetical protein SVIOM74S_00248 [Streptomyces violarus]
MVDARGTASRLRLAGVSQHRRRTPAKQTKQGKQRQVLVVAMAVALVVVAAGVSLGLWAASGGDGGVTGPEARPSQGRTAAAPHGTSPEGSPSPSRSYALSKAPRTIPAVREHTAARGPGWRPTSGNRVVVDDPALADEGRLIAGELGMTYEGEKDDRRAGDLRLALNEDKGANPESYVMTVRGGRVEISGPADAGVFYGTRTLKQEVHDGGTAPEGVVRDEPAKAQRGFMLDIARKNFTADWIEDRVRELGDLKFNQLGLHFSDDQGFRIESDSHPGIVSQPHLTKAQRAADPPPPRHRPGRRLVGRRAPGPYGGHVAARRRGHCAARSPSWKSWPDTASAGLRRALEVSIEGLLGVARSFSRRSRQRS